MQTYRWAVLVAGYFACLTPAWAAGYGLREFSTDGMGAAFAGVAATTTDASFLAYNPATSSSVSSSDFSLNAVGIFPTSSADYTTASTSAGTPTGGDRKPNGFIDNAPLPELGARTRLSDRLSAGIVIYAPWGLSTTYPKTSAPRYYAEQSKLLTLNITPSVSYDVSPQLTLAAGLQIEYAKGTLSNAVDIGTLGVLVGIPGAVPGHFDGSAKFVADDWGMGYVIGALAHLTDDLTVGLSYHSAIRHRLDGDLTFKLDPAGLGKAIKTATGLFSNTTGTAQLTTPDTIHFGVRADVAPQWTALLELDWTNWKKFRDLKVNPTNPAQPTDVTIADWKAGYFTAVGFDYHPEGAWSFRAGAAYDESPIPDSTLGPRIPDADRYNLAFGATYRMDSSSDLKFAFEHLFLSDRNVHLTPTQTGNALRGTLAGTTQSGVNVFGVQWVYRVP